MNYFKKKELQVKLEKVLEQLKSDNIPEEFMLYSNIDRGRVKYINNRVWEFDLNIEYHERENVLFFEYEGDEEPGIDIEFPSMS